MHTSSAPSLIRSVSTERNNIYRRDIYECGHLRHEFDPRELIKMYIAECIKKACTEETESGTNNLISANVASSRINGRRQATVWRKICLCYLTGLILSGIKRPYLVYRTDGLGECKNYSSEI